ncbi:hypothetical protein CKF54_00485 [Psittacicella hinzii]|uniref:Uncharacterized protein n=1 Tax=Psittacicella hinzii TaxID=2028575 RepID=A0A3A1YEM1_9GAMM|nr:tape measure protein [Psittacicella hinzii]RIY34507.1 hypothetical protein CKF54_00485 [Psittacicella hinzii]
MASQQEFDFKVAFDTTEAVNSSLGGAKAIDTLNDSLQELTDNSQAIKNFASDVTKGIKSMGDLATANKKSFESLQEVSTFTNQFTSNIRDISSSVKDYSSSLDKSTNENLEFVASLHYISKALTSISGAVKDVKALKELGTSRFKLPVTDSQLQKLVNIGQQMGGLQSQLAPASQSFQTLKVHLTGVTSSLDTQRQSINLYISSLKKFSSQVSDIKKIRNDLAATSKAIDSTREKLNSTKSATRELEGTVGKLNRELEQANKEPVKLTTNQLKALAELNTKFNSISEATPNFVKSMQSIASSFGDLYEVIVKINQQLPEFLRAIRETGNLSKVLVSLAREISKSKLGIDSLGEASDKAGKKVEDFSKELTEAGKNAFDFGDKAKEAGDHIDELTEKASSGQSALGGLVGKLAGVFAVGFSFDQVKDSAQAYQDLSTKIALVKTSGEDTTAILNELFEVSSQARQPIEATAEAYVTLRKSTEGLGLKQKDLISLTSTLNKAIAIGGSSAEATKNSMVQFSQALSMGYLSGQNFNSVAEQTPGLIDAIARGMGMTSAQLKNYANTSKLTTEQIVQALNATAQETDRIYSTLGVSVGSAITELKNKFTQFVGENDFISDSLAKLILTLANNFGALAEAAKIALYSFAAYKALNFYSTLSSMQSPLTSLKVMWDNLTTAVRKATAAHAGSKTGFSIMAAGASLAKGALAGLTTMWKTFDATVKSTIIGVIVWGIVEAVRALVTWAVKAYNSMQELFYGQKNFDTSHIANLEERKKLAQEQYDAEKANLDAINDQIKALKEANDDKNDVVASEHQHGIEKKMLDDAELQRLQIKRKRLEENVGLAEKELNLVKGLNETTAKTDNNALKIPQVDTKSIPAGIDRYKQNIDQLKDSLAEAKFKLDLFMETGRTQLTQLDQVNMKLAMGAEGYRNLSQAQIEQMQAYAQQLDSVTATMEYMKVLQQNDQAIERLQLELELKGQDQELIEQRLLQYERELELKQLSYLLDQEQMAHVRAMYEERWALEDQLKAKTQENTNLFAQALQQSLPTIEDFNNTVIRGFGSVADGMAQMVVTGQGSMRKLLSAFLKNIAVMIVKAAIVAALLTAMNYIVPGSGQAVANAFNLSAQAAMKSGNTGGLGANPIGAIMGFSSGGYTGNVATDKVAGVVHGREYVINAAATSKYGVDFLDKLNSQSVEVNKSKSSSSSNSNGNGVNVNVNVHNYVGNAEPRVEYGENGNIEIYIHEKVKEEVANAMVEREMR